MHGVVIALAVVMIMIGVVMMRSRPHFCRVVPTNVHISVQSEEHRAVVNLPSQKLDALRLELTCGRWWAPLGS